jgi:hypothetical protein
MKTTMNIEDLLTEDPSIPGQNYAIISYILPQPGKNELDRVMFKFRGAYRTLEECEKKAKQLANKEEHNYINIYSIQVGSWGRLLSPEEIAENKDDIDIDYENEMMNDMMKGYRAQKDKVDKEYEDRKKFRLKQLKFDSSKEGQEYMKNVRENLISIENRLQKYKEDIIYNNETLEYVNKRLETNQNIIEELTNIADDPDFETKIKENEEFINEFNKQKQQEISRLEAEREKIDASIVKLQKLKETTDTHSIHARIKENQDLIDYSLKNKITLKNKIQELQKLVKETEAEIEQRKKEEEILATGQLTKESLIEAAKHMKFN